MDVKEELRFYELIKNYQNSPVKEALRYTIEIIQNYQMDINNSEWTGVDLVEKGFCQGVIYKNALKRVNDLLCAA